MVHCFEARVFSPLQSSDKQGKKEIGQGAVEVKIVKSNERENKNNHDWMESIEKISGGTPGAYDVLRCDLSYDSESNLVKCCKVWGFDFHLSRLKNSFHRLITCYEEQGRSNYPLEEVSVDSAIDLQILDQAALKSKAVADELILHLCSFCQKRKLQSFKKEKTFFMVSKLTLLWTPCEALKGSPCLNLESIDVRGHISTDGKILNSITEQSFVMTTLALPHPLHLTDHEGRIGNIISLPTQVDLSNAKVSSWSRERRKILDQFQPYRQSDEILLINKISDESLSHHDSTGSDDMDDLDGYVNKFEILEGITSNFFAIYHDNTLRTAKDGILSGYVRHLVLKYAPRCGLTLDLRPCKVRDAKQGLWKEAFITSSSRLLQPVEKVVVYTQQHKDAQHEDSCDEKQKRGPWKEIWTYDHDADRKRKTDRKWELLLKEILSNGGYQI